MARASISIDWRDDQKKDDANRLTQHLPFANNVARVAEAWAGSAEEFGPAKCRNGEGPNIVHQCSIARSPTIHGDLVTAVVRRRRTNKTVVDSSRWNVARSFLSVPGRLARVYGSDIEYRYSVHSSELSNVAAVKLVLISSCERCTADSI